MPDFSPVIQFVRSLNDYGLYFLFSSRPERGAYWSDPQALEKRLTEAVNRSASYERGDRWFEGLLQKDIGHIGSRIEHIEEAIENHIKNEQVSASFYYMLDAVLAYRLQSMVMEKSPLFHPQNLRYLINYFYGRRPELLLILESLLTVIADPDRFAIEEKSRACRVLVNHYRSECVFIYTALNTGLTHTKKRFIYAWLTAFQRIYQRIHEITFDKQKDKNRVARIWFGSTLPRLKKEGSIPRKSYRIPLFVRNFIEHCLNNDPDPMLTTGRGLLLTVSNQDVIRIMNRIIQDDKQLFKQRDMVIHIYHELYLIMRHYRELCTELRASQASMKNQYATISDQIRQSDALQTTGRRKATPILGKREDHELLEETRRNLTESNLLPFFDIWPIPIVSQHIFNTVCRLKDKIPQRRDHLVGHFMYREKLFEFLMRLERIGIKAVQPSDLPLITSAFQLNTFNLIKKHTYLGSTGHWSAPNLKPPSVICCTNPNVLGNCHGRLLRHVALRVFMATGEFYESPFILDSTPRFGHLEEDGIEGLLIRPGLFLLNIPQAVLDHWRKEEDRQLNFRLKKMIDERIDMERLIL